MPQATSLLAVATAVASLVSVKAFQGSMIGVHWRHQAAACKRPKISSEPPLLSLAASAADPLSGARDVLIVGGGARYDPTVL